MPPAGGVSALEATRRIERDVVPLIMDLIHTIVDLIHNKVVGFDPDHNAVQALAEILDQPHEATYLKPFAGLARRLGLMRWQA